jgi:hypothetical protein
MACSIEMPDAPSAVTDDEKAIESPEGGSRNSKNVHCCDYLAVVF